MPSYDWIPFYEELATSLIQYQNNRPALLEKCRHAYSQVSLSFPKTEDGDPNDIDPFTFFGFFNKGISYEHRIELLATFKNEFHLESSTPTNFDGIPLLHNLSATFYAFRDERNANDIDNLWHLFSTSLTLAENENDFNRLEFIDAYNKVLDQKRISYNITMGLFWIRPNVFPPLDGTSRTAIIEKELISSAASRLKSVPKGSEYLDIKAELSTSLNGKKSFAELSSDFWDEHTENNIQYWTYAPGPNASKWEEVYNHGVIAVGWEEIGNYTSYSTKDEMQNAIQMNTTAKDAYAPWNFLTSLKPGDIVFARKGKHCIVGVGEVESDYIYDSTLIDNYPNLRKINWFKKGEWYIPKQMNINTLWNVTENVELKNLLENTVLNQDILLDDKKLNDTAFTTQDFLSQVFLSSNQVTELTHLIKNKKNIILQGAPGVGKTYIAKRLAYLLTGTKNKSQIELVQFHQNYSYEDFIMGYRPTKNGFELKKGIFFDFCKRAEQDPANKYCFIIDEINRGNLSKIMGELFMLLEADKRGEQIKLAYSNDLFTVPENVYLIGTMNTADRSLALIDYALRRRFAFYKLSPAFATHQFKNYAASLNNDEIIRLINCIETLNAEILRDDSLGEGFCIGHSYFCNMTKDTICHEQLVEIIRYEIMPLLEEYWFDEKEKAEDWSNKLINSIRL